MTIITQGYGQNIEWDSGIMASVDINVGNRLILYQVIGGTITISGGYFIHTFTESATFTTIIPLNVEVLVVAGGGGGGGNHGGGGGAGGIVYHSSKTLTPQLYTVSVGNGGIGHPVAGGGTSGENSSFAGITAVGGGRGGGYNTFEGPLPGGSGAGGTSRGGYTTGAVATQINSGGGVGYGNAGGNAVTGFVDWPGGGGGGGGVVGGNATTTGYGGNGGNGYQSSISGTSTYYGGGGGGCGNNNVPGYFGVGGLGGGGNGGVAITDAVAGTPNTGGGGGGQRNGDGKNGGSGIVIIRYPTIGTHSIIIDVGPSSTSNTLSWSSIEDPNITPISEINTVQYATPRTISIRGNNTPPSEHELGTFYDSEGIEHSHWKVWGTTTPSSWEEVSNTGSIITSFRFIEIRETLRKN